ncbi:hypothetical protein BG011_001886 [Mortierella polycephala]|uniref:Uncharacterized protein n=1 Tax=Mortierella polycephala TaxID=41804 RepID=A0A9P6Q792_9FUNG|nr:hypothetical protein BG011_001886 [Mortierella polycephala]
MISAPINPPPPTTAATWLGFDPLNQLSHLYPQRHHHQQRQEQGQSPPMGYYYSYAYGSQTHPHLNAVPHLVQTLNPVPFVKYPDMAPSTAAATTTGRSMSIPISPDPHIYAYATTEQSGGLEIVEAAWPQQQQQNDSFTPTHAMQMVQQQRLQQQCHYAPVQGPASQRLSPIQAMSQQSFVKQQQQLENQQAPPKPRLEELLPQQQQQQQQQKAQPQNLDQVRYPIAALLPSLPQCMDQDGVQPFSPVSSNNSNTGRGNEIGSGSGSGRGNNSQQGSSGNGGVSGSGNGSDSCRSRSRSMTLSQSRDEGVVVSIEDPPLNISNESGSWSSSSENPIGVGFRKLSAETLSGTGTRARSDAVLVATMAMETAASNVGGTSASMDTSTQSVLGGGSRAERNRRRREKSVSPSYSANTSSSSPSTSSSRRRSGGDSNSSNSQCRQSRHFRPNPPQQQQQQTQQRNIGSSSGDGGGGDDRSNDGPRSIGNGSWRGGSSGSMSSGNGSGIQSGSGNDTGDHSADRSSDKYRHQGIGGNRRKHKNKSRSSRLSRHPVNPSVADTTSGGGEGDSNREVDGVRQASNDTLSTSSYNGRGGSGGNNVAKNKDRFNRKGKGNSNNAPASSVAPAATIAPQQ